MRDVRYEMVSGAMIGAQNPAVLFRVAVDKSLRFGTLYFSFETAIILSAIGSSERTVFLIAVGLNGVGVDCILRRFERVRLRVGPPAGTTSQDD